MKCGIVLKVLFCTFFLSVPLLPAYQTTSMTHIDIDQWVEEPVLLSIAASVDVCIDNLDLDPQKEAIVKKILAMNKKPVSRENIQLVKEFLSHAIASRVKNGFSPNIQAVDTCAKEVLDEAMKFAALVSEQKPQSGGFSFSRMALLASIVYFVKLLFGIYSTVNTVYGAVEMVGTAVSSVGSAVGSVASLVGASGDATRGAIDGLRTEVRADIGALATAQQDGFAAIHDGMGTMRTELTAAQQAGFGTLRADMLAMGDGITAAHAAALATLETGIRDDMGRMGGDITAQREALAALNDLVERQHAALLALHESSAAANADQIRELEERFAATLATSLGQLQGIVEGVERGAAAHGRVLETLGASAVRSGDETQALRLDMVRALERIDATRLLLTQVHEGMGRSDARTEVLSRDLAVMTERVDATRGTLTSLAGRVDGLNDFVRDDAADRAKELGALQIALLESMRKYAAAPEGVNREQTWESLTQNFLAYAGRVGVDLGAQYVRTWYVGETAVAVNSAQNVNKLLDKLIGLIPVGTTHTYHGPVHCHGGAAAIAAS